MSDYGDLRALFINCTLKRSPEQSSTQALLDKSSRLMVRNGVAVEHVRFVDFEVADGVYPDMREYGWQHDDWPELLWPKVRDADILVIGAPIWLGEPTSVSRRLIERLYAMGDETNEKGQAVYYGKVAGAVIAGNEDGVKNSAKHLLYGLQHMGFTIPPTSETGWIGPIGPGPSYLDEGSGGPENDYTNKTSTFMTWNLLHLARILKDAGGYPAVGNVPSEWESDPGNANPEYR